MDCSPPGFSVHGISQAGILGWAAVPSSGDLSDPGTELASPALAGRSVPPSHQGSPFIAWLMALMGLHCFTSGGYSLWCEGFSKWWHLLLRGIGSSVCRHTGFSCSSTYEGTHLSGPGIKPMPLALAGGFSSTIPRGKSSAYKFWGNTNIKIITRSWNITFWGCFFSLGIIPSDPSKLLYIAVVCSFLLLSSITWYECAIVYCLTIHLLKDNQVVSSFWLWQIKLL